MEPKWGQVKGDAWEEVYRAQSMNLPVLLTVDEAIAWTNGLVAKIEES